MLNTHQMEYLDFTTESGFVVTIHQNGAAGFPMEMGMNIPVGYISSIGILMVTYSWFKTATCYICLNTCLFRPLLRSCLHHTVIASQSQKLKKLSIITMAVTLKQ